MGVRAGREPGQWTGRRYAGVIMPPDVTVLSCQLGGATIAEVLRRAWSRLVRKQWLILYPLALAVINTLAFLAVYAASEGLLGWSAFFEANFEREIYLREHFVDGFAFTPAFGVAVFAGIAACGFMALIRAPFFHAIAGPNYPMAPRKWDEAGRLFLFYLLYFLVLWAAPLALPDGSAWQQVAYALVLVVGILLAFADYVIVFEELGVVPAVRRSVRLLRHAWAPVLGVFIVIYFVSAGLFALYRHYYEGQNTVFVVLPIAQILLNSFIALLVDLVLIFLYENIRRESPAA